MLNKCVKFRYVYNGAQGDVRDGDGWGSEKPHENVFKISGFNNACVFCVVNLQEEPLQQSMSRYIF